MYPDVEADGWLHLFQEVCQGGEVAEDLAVAAALVVVEEEDLEGLEVEAEAGAAPVEAGDHEPSDVRGEKSNVRGET